MRFLSIQAGGLRRRVIEHQRRGRYQQRLIVPRREIETSRDSFPQIPAARSTSAKVQMVS